MNKAQRVLITGSSSGFGFLTAQTLLKEGHTVLATMRGLEGKNAANASQLKAFASSQPGTLHLLELDVTSDASVRAAIGQALELAGHLDVVVNNAGLGTGGLTEAYTTEQFQKVFDVNVFGVQRVNRAVLPSMRERGSGLLIHVSSTLGRIVIPFMGLYLASKFALEALAESYRYELAATGVDVAIVEPGAFGTNFLANVMMPADSATIGSYGPIADIPGQMFGSFGQMLTSDNAPNPQDIADAILTLMQTSAGKRPLRTVVDPMMGGEGPSAINQVSSQVQSQLLNGLGMGNLLSVK